MAEQEGLESKIINMVRINDTSYMPNDVDLKKDIIALIKEAGYVKPTRKLSKGANSDYLRLASKGEPPRDHLG